MNTTPAPAAGRRRNRTWLIVFVVVGAMVVIAAVTTSFRSAASGNDLRAKLTYIAPAAPGGGWDTFVREQQAAARANNLINSSQVVNVPGAGGTIALGKLTTLREQPATLMVTGTGLVAAIEQHKAPISHDDATPIARVVEEYDVVVVPADSPYHSIDDLVRAWRANPKALPWTGGGSFDQLVMIEFATKAGIDPRQTTYIPSSGGGEAAQALLAKTARAATSGYRDMADQIEAGRLRALGVATSERIEGIDLPTLAEQGYDVTLANWRGLMAPPGVTPEQRAELTELVRDTVATPQWHDAVRRNAWTESYADGAEFEQFLTDERTRVAALLKASGR